MRTNSSFGRVLLLAGVAMALVLVGKSPGQTPAPPAKTHIIDKILEEADPELAKRVAKERDKALAADLKKLGAEKVEAARTSLDAYHKFFMMQRETIDAVLKAADRLTVAELEVADNVDQRLAILERRWKIAAALHEITKVRFEAGRTGVHELNDSNYFRIEAQQKWLEAVAAKKKK